MRIVKRFLAVILTLAVLALPFIVYFNARAIGDWWDLRGYTPPQAIAALAAQDTMLPHTQHLFYVNKPQIVSGVVNFRKNCPDATQTIVLGCYHGGDNGIFIYSVSDPLLYGVEQVTAAHEVLHSVYARLSSHDRATLNAELQNYYQSGLKDPRVIAEVKLYQQTEPNDVMDEMSCTFGTEIADLPPALNAYYAKYFANRQAIVGFEQKYQAEFSSREAQATAYSDQLTQMKTSINDEEQTLQTQLAQINSDRARLDSERSDGQVDQYNQGVYSFNSEVDSYNQGVEQLKTDIAAYNQLVSQYNSLASQLADLDQAIDTRLAPQTTQ